MLTAAATLRVLLFVGGIAAVYVLAALLLLRQVQRHRAARRGASVRPTPSWLRLVAGADLTLAGIGLLCFAWGTFVEPGWLEISRHELLNTKLPPGALPIRIAHLSDLHCEDVDRLEREAVRLLSEEKPDLVVLCGDCANDATGLPRLREMLRGLAAVAPTYAVRGNWDIESRVPPGIFEDEGVHELDGRGTTLLVRGTPVWVGGAAFGDRRAHERALAQVPPDAITLYLTHTPDDVIGPTPDVFHEGAAHPVDLCFAGHTHGGQVALPFYGALVTFSRYDKRFEHGLYKLGDTWLSVNRGLGLDGSYLPRVRFCARPELSLYELVPAQLEE